jgi:hypothetical protein
MHLLLFLLLPCKHFNLFHSLFLLSPEGFLGLFHSFLLFSDPLIVCHSRLVVKKLLLCDLGVAARVTHLAHHFKLGPEMVFVDGVHLTESFFNLIFFYLKLSSAYGLLFN